MTFTQAETLGSKINYNTCICFDFWMPVHVCTLYLQSIHVLAQGQSISLPFQYRIQNMNVSGYWKRGYVYDTVQCNGIMIVYTYYTNTTDACTLRPANISPRKAIVNKIKMDLAYHAYCIFSIDISLFKSMLQSLMIVCVWVCKPLSPIGMNLEGWTTVIVEK